jgi:mannose-1-phosphate guanylyltransferase
MTSTTHHPLWALILAGGDGRRLGALTTTIDGVSTPKQYCSLNGGPSLLQLSLQRALRLVPRERILVIVTEPHRRWWERQLADLLPRSNIVVQPCNRGTGIGLLLPLLVLEKLSPKAIVACLPSDHYVADESELASSLQRAVALCAHTCDKLTLLGIQPTFPDSSLGYLTSFDDSEGEVRPVQEFVEKPDRDQAARLIEAGGVWNSAIFVGLLQAALYLYPRHAPGLLATLKPLVRAWADPQSPSHELMAFYARHVEVDFSRDILQKQPARLQMLKVPPCGWNDVGTPVRLLTTLRALPPGSDRPPGPTSHAGALNLSTVFFSSTVKSERPGVQ